MLPGDDNVFRRLSPGRGSGLLDALGAVLAGNALYFLLLLPRLPEPWQHQSFALDRGLGLDFLICLSLYGLVRTVRARV
ncbi:MAG: hypothetical protein HY656_01925 [Acidobacteria bacterium]|nr:hypothetical protein [Acidobacteriota bacterium]